MSWLKAITLLLQYAPAIIEAIKNARERHPEEHKESFVAPKPAEVPPVPEVK